MVLLEVVVTALVKEVDIVITIEATKLVVELKETLTLVDIPGRDDGLEMKLKE